MHGTIHTGNEIRIRRLCSLHNIALMMYAPLIYAWHDVACRGVA